MSQTLDVEILRDVRLYGALGKKYGKVHRLAVRSCREATQALGQLLPGFAKDVIGHEAGFHVFAGTRDAEGNIGTEALDSPVRDGDTIFVVPLIAGRKKSGLLQTVIGVALIVVGFFVGGATWGPAMMMLGAGLAIGGVIQMATPTTSSSSSEDTVSSYRFSGPANITKQGVAVPVVYGEVIAGSVVASQGLKSVEKAIT